MHTRQKSCLFWYHVAMVKLFCEKKSFVPVTWAGEVIWKNFDPGYWDLGCKDQDLSDWASPACEMNTSTFFMRKGDCGKARSQKSSQPSWPGSYEDAVSWKYLHNSMKSFVLASCSLIFVQWKWKKQQISWQLYIVQYLWNICQQRKVLCDKSVSVRQIWSVTKS